MESTNSDKIYILMNKPSGCVCTAASDSHQTVFELLPEEVQKLQKAKRGLKLHTVGRLDCDTSGLLLITNDGAFSHQLTAPETHVSKKYYVELLKNVTLESQKIYIEEFAKGLLIPADKKFPEVFVKGATLSFITATTCEVEICEGKFHQIKRMFLAMGNQVVKLQRISMGDFTLPDDLTEGSWKYICIT